MSNVIDFREPFSDVANDSIRRYVEIQVEMRREWQRGRSDYEYLCMEDFVLREGQVFTGMSPRDPKYKRGYLKHCFYNAYLAAARSRGNLRYVEGYATTVNGFMPVLHAWCIDRDDLVVETTWRGAPLGVEMIPSAYMGVVFDMDHVRSTRTDENGSMIDRWEDRWPLLKKPYRVDTVAA